MATALATLTRTPLCGLLLHFLGQRGWCVRTTIDYAEEHELLRFFFTITANEATSASSSSAYFAYFLLLLLTIISGARPQPQPPDYLTLNFKHTNEHTHTDRRSVTHRHSHAPALMLLLILLLPSSFYTAHFCSSPAIITTITRLGLEFTSPSSSFLPVAKLNRCSISSSSRLPFFFFILCLTLV